MPAKQIAIIEIKQFPYGMGLGRHYYAFVNNHYVEFGSGLKYKCNWLSYDAAYKAAVKWARQNNYKVEKVKNDTTDNPELEGL